MNNETEKDLHIKEVIIQTTIKIIKLEGLEKVTIRKIAKEADVNIASISYYFGSKENLINEVLHLFISNFKGAFTILEDSTIEAKERLKKFLNNYFSIALKHPDVMKNIVGRGLFTYPSQQEFLSFLKFMGADELKKTIKEITKEEDNDILTMRLIQMIGAIVFPILMATPLSFITNTDFSKEAQMSLYINTLVDNLL